MSIRYEIVPRGKDEHRAGHLALVIEGIDAERTVDPAQFLPKSLRQAADEAKAAGKSLDPAALAIRAEEICRDYAERAHRRTIDRLRKGSLLPGGLAVGPQGLKAEKFALEAPARQDEKNAVEAFLNRGHLLGLTKEERAERAKRRNQKRDHVAEWLKGRKALIAQRQKELAEAKSKLASNPKMARVVAMLEKELKALQVPVVAASHGYQYAYGQYLTKQVNLVNDDIRLVPCMTNTTVDTERDAKDAVSDFTTLDEFDGSGYSTGGSALDSQAVNIDDANDRAEFDAADEVRSALGAGTRSIQGELLISFITTLNGSLPLHWIEYAANKTPDGSDFTVVMNAEGILQAADG